jgi:hypothetical protein
MFVNDDYKKYIFDDDVMEIDDELIEKIILNQYDFIEINSNFNSQIDNLPDNIKCIQWSSNNKFNTQINKYPSQLEKILMYDCVEFNPEKFFIPKTLKKILLPQYYHGPKIDFEYGLNDLKMYFSQYKYHLDNLPNTLESLFICCDRNNKNITNDGFIVDIILPESLKTLKIISDLLKFNVGELPENLEILVFVSNRLNIIKTNNIVWDNLPTKLLELHINLDYFDEPLNNLPTGLKKLYICSNLFNKPVDMLPESLQVLDIKCDSFNKNISNLPNELEELNIISLAFNQSLGNLPSELKNLKLYLRYCNYNLENIPNKLKNLYCKTDGDELHIKKTNISNLLNNLPNNLDNLVLDNYILPLNYISDELRYLYILYDDHTLNNYIYNYLQNNYKLYKNLKHLGLLFDYYIELPDLPNGLEILILKNNYYDFPITNIPISINTLQLHTPKFSHELALIDTNIEYLYLEIKSIKSVINLPSNLKYFHIKCKEFDLIDLENLSQNPISNLLINCPNLIYFGIEFELEPVYKDNEHIANLDLIFNSLPDSINYLFVGFTEYKINLTNIPKNLKEIAYTYNKKLNNEKEHKEHYKSIKNKFNDKFKIIRFYLASNIYKNKIIKSCCSNTDYKNN